MSDEKADSGSIELVMALPDETLERAKPHHVEDKPRREGDAITLLWTLPGDLAERLPRPSEPSADERNGGRAG